MEPVTSGLERIESEMDFANAAAGDEVGEVVLVIFWIGKVASPPNSGLEKIQVSLPPLPVALVRRRDQPLSNGARVSIAVCVFAVTVKLLVFFCVDGQTISPLLAIEAVVSWWRICSL